MPSACLATLVCSLLLILAAPAVQAEAGAVHSTPTRQIRLEAPRLSRLAGFQIAALPGERFDFASITLEVLRNAYAAALQRSFDERPQSAKRRRKLVRWQKATGELVGTLDAALTRLHAGARFQVHVDGREQVFIFVDGQPIAVAGPNPGADRQIERRVVSTFCSLHDCAILDTEEQRMQPVVDSRAASWDLRQNHRPAFEIEARLRCEFSALDRRRDKALACRGLDAELELLIDALRQARRGGHTIDWETLAARADDTGADSALIINRRGSFLQLHLPLARRIDARDWRELVGWLQRGKTGRHAAIIANADLLLD